jgi:hypothetical protein
LKSKSGWNDYKDKSGNGTDDYVFSALPGGGRRYDGNFYSADYYGCGSAPQTARDRKTYPQNEYEDGEPPKKYPIKNTQNDKPAKSYHVKPF